MIGDVHFSTAGIRYRIHECRDHALLQIDGLSETPLPAFYMKNNAESKPERMQVDFSRSLQMLSEECLGNSISRSTPGSRRVTPSKTLPTEIRTPNSRKDRQFGGSVPRISIDTVHRVLTAEIKCNYLIIDCRYQYEFNAGHIAGAVSCPPSEKLMLMDWLFSSEYGITRKGPMVLVMHCEFSQCRAPRMATDVIRQYAGLGVNTGLEVYVMKGGYCDFFRHYPQWCDPVGYMPMHAAGVDVPGTSSAPPCEFDVEMFIERSTLSSQKGRNRRPERYSSTSLCADSPFFRSACSPMDYSPARVVADLARVFIDEEGPDDSSSGSRRTVNIHTEDDGDNFSFDDDGGPDLDDDQDEGYAFKRSLDEGEIVGGTSNISPSRSSSSSSFFLLPAGKRRASMPEAVVTGDSS